MFIYRVLAGQVTVASTAKGKSSIRIGKGKRPMPPFKRKRVFAKMRSEKLSYKRSFAHADESVNDMDLEPDVVGSGTSNAAVAKESETDSVEF